MKKVISIAIKKTTISKITRISETEVYLSKQKNCTRTEYEALLRNVFCIIVTTFIPMMIVLEMCDGVIFLIVTSCSTPYSDNHKQHLVQH